MQTTVQTDKCFEKQNTKKTFDIIQKETGEQKENVTGL